MSTFSSLATAAYIPGTGASIGLAKRGRDVAFHIRTRAALRQLDDHQLRDIGLTHDAALKEANRSLMAVFLNL